MCQYDLTETERQPILQAEALKEKDKAIAHLQDQLQLLQSQPQVKLEPRDDDYTVNGHQRIPIPSLAPTRPMNVRQQRYHGGVLNDSIYFGTPRITSVMEEFANLSVNGQPANLTHLIPRGTDMAAYHIRPSNPFPAFWRTAEGTQGLINLLPKDHQEIFFHLNAFQRRAQYFSFPHLPSQCSEREVRRFLANLKDDAEQHPDTLALLLATLAQGIQHGVYDKYGGAWHSGTMESESRLSNAFVAASMQCLSLASYCNRPKLLTVETLVMLGPYLTNSGRFLDAWALFGTTIRLAQSIGFPAKEAAVRKNLWWWIMHMDQQYSITLGRPLGISSMGDCPPPEPLAQDPAAFSLSSYTSQFTILTRQILSTGYLNDPQIDEYTEQLLALQHTLPRILQFDETWLHPDKPIPSWPLNMQAATMHAKTHTYILLLNRQRSSSDDSQHRARAAGSNRHSHGRRYVLRSCRAVLQVFEFIRVRIPAGFLCWTVGQQAFNAAMLLVYSMVETNEATDLDVIQRAYSTFVEMQRLGIHKLAEAAVDRLGALIKDVPSGHVSKESVMGQSGMMLLEDPGLQGFLDSGFTPLEFEMTGDTHAHTDRPRKHRRTTHGHREREENDPKSSIAARSGKQGSQRKAHSGRSAKPRSISTTKPGPRPTRPTMRQRHSGLPSPSMTEPSDRLQMPNDVTTWPLNPSSLAAADLAHQPERISPPLLSPSQDMFNNFPTNDFETQVQIPQHHTQDLTPVQRAQTAFPESRPSFLHHQTSSDNNIQPVNYSAQMTPHNLTPTDFTPTDMINGSFQTTPRIDFAATYGHFHQPHVHQQTPLHTPPFSASFTTGEIPCSYPGHF
ncbi:MAG: hypothetical protein Q9222_003886 [Ikaeria aurantiellina]